MVASYSMVMLGTAPRQCIGVSMLTASNPQAKANVSQKRSSTASVAQTPERFRIQYHPDTIHAHFLKHMPDKLYTKPRI